MNGAPSQVDTFDPKPALTKFHGTAYRGKTPVGSNGRPDRPPDEVAVPVHASTAQSGLEISSLFPHTARFADDLCVIRSMHTDTAAHASGCLQMNTGSVLIGKPSLGRWLSYGLGTENERPAQLRGDDRPARRADRRRLELDGRATCRPPTRGRSSAARARPLLDLATPAGTTARAPSGTRSTCSRS